VACAHGSRRITDDDREEEEQEMRGGAKRLAAVAAVSICAMSSTIPDRALALRDDVFTSETQPANTLLMPFDVTDDLQTYLQVSNLEGISASSTPKITTHWAFWSESCTHLFDTSICLTLEDTIVVDPRNVSAIDEANAPVGPVADLSGERGFVTVTAYATDDSCGGPEVLGFDLVDDAIVGTVTLADDGTDAAVGFDAIGLGLDPSGQFVDLPDFLLSPDAGSGFLDIQTLPIPDLEVARVIYLAVAENTGKLAGEIGPIGRDVTAAATFIDNLEIPISLPNVSIECARFASLHSGGDDPLVPPTVTIESSGIFRLTNIFAGAEPVGDADGQNGNDTWLYGAYAQQLGPFGTGNRAKYPVIFSDGQPTPTPRPTPTPTTAATPSPTPTSAGPTPGPTQTPGSATPTPTATAASTACEQATLTITVTHEVSDAAGVTTSISYPASASLPGTANQPTVLDRVENLTGVSGGLFSVGDNDADPNDATLVVGLVSPAAAVPSGPFAEVTFDCEGEAPVLADFACTPDVSSVLGNTVESTCTLALDVTP
jgi:hypothetical protein